jgi:hypothetical protein
MSSAIIWRGFARTAWKWDRSLQCSAIIVEKVLSDQKQRHEYAHRPTLRHAQNVENPSELHLLNSVSSAGRIGTEVLLVRLPSNYGRCYKFPA